MTDKLHKDNNAFAFATITRRDDTYIANLEVSLLGTDLSQNYGPQPAKSVEEARMWVVSGAKLHGFTRNTVVFDYDL